MANEPDGGGLGWIRSMTTHDCVMSFSSNMGDQGKVHDDAVVGDVSCHVLEFDEALKKHVGEFGKYQRWVCVFLSLVGVSNAFFIMDIVFVAAPPEEFWCASPNVSIATPAFATINNQSDYAELNNGPESINARCNLAEATNRLAGFGLEGNNSQIWNGSDYKGSLGRAPCQKWAFGPSDFEDSIIKQWELVCSRSWYVASSNSAFLAGTLVGVLSGGFLSDRFGRRLVLAGFSAAAILFRVILAFSPSVLFFIVLRFLVGFTNYDTYTSAFVLGTELVGPSWRVFFCSMMGLSWALGYMLVAAVSFLLRHQSWRTLTLALTACCCYVLLYIKLVPESPRWQLSKGKKKEAMQTLRRMAKVNGGHLPDDVDIVVIQAEQKHMRPLTILRSPAVRWRSGIILYTWFAVAIVYYGLSLNVGDLAGNIYLNTFIMGAVEVPAYFLAQWLLNSRMGRRGSLAMLLAVSAASLPFVYFVHKSSLIAGTVLAMLGKLSVTAAFSAAYVITAEMFPTTIRQAALSVAATVGRVGGVLAPFVGHLSKFNPVIPPISYGLLTLTASVLSLFLPETRGRSLPVNIEDIDRHYGSGLLCGSSQDSDEESTDSSNTSDVIREVKVPLTDGEMTV